MVERTRSCVRSETDQHTMRPRVKIQIFSGWNTVFVDSRKSMSVVATGSRSPATKPLLNQSPLLRASADDLPRLKPRTAR